MVNDGITEVNPIRTIPHWGFLYMRPCLRERQNAARGKAMPLPRSLATNMLPRRDGMTKITYQVKVKQA